MASSGNRRIRRAAEARRRRRSRLAAAALAAGAMGLGAGSAQAAPVGWTPGLGAGTYDSSDLAAGVNLDLDGDANVDFVLSLGYGGYGGDSILLTPQIVASINNRVYVDGCCNVVRYAAPADVLAATEYTLSAPESAVLWDPVFHTAFESGGFAGLIFEIPGGSPYYGYLDVGVSNDGGLELTVNETAFRAVPEPGGAGLLLLGALGLALRRLLG
jgi:hypothetical protein